MENLFSNVSFFSATESLLNFILIDRLVVEALHHVHLSKNITEMTWAKRPNDTTDNTAFQKRVTYSYRVPTVILYTPKGSDVNRGKLPESWGHHAKRIPQANTLTHFFPIHFTQIISIFILLAGKDEIGFNATSVSRNSFSYELVYA